jgi:hypothetical protein
MFDWFVYGIAFLVALYTLRRIVVYTVCTTILYFIALSVTLIYVWLVHFPAPASSLL